MTEIGDKVVAIPSGDSFLLCSPASPDVGDQVLVYPLSTGQYVAIYIADVSQDDAVVTIPVNGQRVTVSVSTIHIPSIVYMGTACPTRHYWAAGFLSSGQHVLVGTTTFTWDGVGQILISASQSALSNAYAWYAAKFKNTDTGSSITVIGSTNYSVGIGTPDISSILSIGSNSVETYVIAPTAHSYCEIRICYILNVR